MSAILINLSNTLLFNRLPINAHLDMPKIYVKHKFRVQRIRSTQMFGVAAESRVRRNGVVPGNTWCLTNFFSSKRTISVDSIAKLVNTRMFLF